MKLSINLASRHHINQRVVRLVICMVFLLLVSVLLCQGKGYLGDYRLAQTYQSHLNELKTQLHGELPEQIDPQQLAKQRSNYDQAQKLLRRDAFRWTTLFDRMENLLPREVSLLSFNPHYENNSLKINGLARDLKSLQQLLDNLQSERFDPVYLNSQGQTEVDDGHGGKRMALTFTISLGRVF